jgi:hypothetical protein
MNNKTSQKNLAAVFWRETPDLSLNMVQLQQLHTKSFIIKLLLWHCKKSRAILLTIKVFVGEEV